MIADEPIKPPEDIAVDLAENPAVNVGPVAAVSKGVTSRDLVLQAMPMAYQLDQWFRLHLVVVNPLEELENRHGSCGVAGTVHLWTQLNIDRQAAGETLAKTIAERFGSRVAFSQLLIPRTGVECTGHSKSGNVWVRHVVCYDIGTDELMQRWDVLVRAVK